MTHVKKGQLTALKEWRKHLRFWKKFYWRAERREARRQANQEAKARPPRRAFDFGEHFTFRYEQGRQNRRAPSP